MYKLNKLISGSNKLIILLHIAAWTVFFLIPVYFVFTSYNAERFMVVWVSIFTINMLFIFYINYLLLIPRLFFKGKRLLYYSVLVCVISCFYLIGNITGKILIEKNLPVTEVPKPPHGKHKPPRKFEIYNHFFTSILVSGFSLGLAISVKYVENEKKNKELEKERLNSELAFLKNQISPHFFFNTLNNIYSLTEFDPAEAKKAIMRLSKLMRYLLYESDTLTISLDKEVNFIKSYIDLMRLRISPEIKISVKLPENQTEPAIAPLLFIPFIENAFKHGIGKSANSFIDIELKTDSGDNLFFRCENSYSEASSEPDSGIGLDNIKKRLGLLYPEKHKLEISSTTNRFTVNLSIQNS